MRNLLSATRPDERARKRAYKHAQETPNDLEEWLDRARVTGDDDMALRALSREPVWHLGPPGSAHAGSDEGPVHRSTPASQLVLPTAPGADGRPWVLAFSSRAALTAHHGADPDAPHVQTPAGQLFGLLGPEARVLLNASGPRMLPLEPWAVTTVADLFAGRHVRAAFRAGPATETLHAPLGGRALDICEPLRKAAQALPQVVSVWACQAALDEPDAQVHLLVEVQVTDDVTDEDWAATAETLVRAGEAATDMHFRLDRFTERRVDPVVSWMADNVEPVYTRWGSR